MTFNFPNSPSLNDTHTVGDKTWIYTGVAWRLQSNLTDSVLGLVSNTLDTKTVTANSEYFIANGEINSFTITTTELISRVNNSIVTLDGLLQVPGVHYNVTANVITFSTNPLANSVIEIRLFEFVEANNILEVREYVPGNSFFTAVFDQSNAAFDAANTAQGDATGAYAHANGAYAHSNGAFDAANTAQGDATGAYAHANGAFDAANTAQGDATGAYAHANGAFGHANGAFGHANGAFDAANTAQGDATAAFSTANTASNTFMIIALSDESTALEVTESVVKFRAPFGMTLYQTPRASLNVASSSGTVEVNIKDDGTTIFTTNLTVDASETTSTTAATPAVLSSTSIADDSLISLDIVSAGTDASGLKVTLYYRRT